MKEIVVAGGCFWGVEKYMGLLEGVKETVVGYANGHLPDPSYEEVCTGQTGHAEACYIQYDESVLSLDQLLEAFWKIIDPTLLNQQGNDVGPQYRTGIYYSDPLDLLIIQDSKEKQHLKYDAPIVTEIQPLKIFYPAEKYHQKYLEKNPNGYCHITI